MPWKSTAISTVGTLFGGALGGGSKAPERAAKDAAARAQYGLDVERKLARQDISPYVNTGNAANQKLSELLGIAEPTGYSKKPELQDYIEKLRSEYFDASGKDYNRKTNVYGRNIEAKRRYDADLAKWQTGYSAYKEQNPNSRGDGSLLKSFTNDDFVKDPGYTARLLEGELGTKRNLISLGASDSGQALKELEKYRQTFASNEFGNAYNRDSLNKSRQYDFLSNTANRGLGAIQNNSSLSANLAGQAGQTGVNTANNNAILAGQRADNKSNSFQSALENLIYGMNRNQDYGRIDNYSYSGGSSRLPAGSFANQFVG